MTTKRVLIFAGGDIDADFLSEIRRDDYVIGADRGALFLVQRGVKPHLSVGDFDSVSAEEFEQIKSSSKEVIACDAVNKDLTDAELAYNIAIERQADEIIMTGVMGSRFDHTLANIQMMLRGIQHQITTVIRDSNNYVTLTESVCRLEDHGFTYVSLLPLTPEVTGITLDGFMYPLDHATLKMGQSLGVSNRLLDKQGTIQIKSGTLLIIQSKD